MCDEGNGTRLRPNVFSLSGRSVIATLSSRFCGECMLLLSGRAGRRGHADVELWFCCD